MLYLMSFECKSTRVLVCSQENFKVRDLSRNSFSQRSWVSVKFNYLPLNLLNIIFMHIIR